MEKGKNVKHSGQNVGVYFSADEIAWIKDQPDGTVRELVQSAMGVPAKIGVPPTKKVVIPKKETNPNICKKCGYILVEGKCINKSCR